MLKRIFSSEIIRNIGVLISGNAIGQIIAFLAYMLLTRIYSKEDFGVFTLFSSVVSLLTILSTGKYEEGILLTKNRKESLELSGFIFKILLGFSIFSGVVLLFFRTAIFTVVNMKPLIAYWYLIPLTVFATGIGFILTSLATKRKKYKSIASFNINCNATSSVLKILLGYFSFTNIGLMLSTCIAQFLACFSFYKLRRDIRLMFSGKWQDEKRAGIKYRAFPKYSMTRNLINSFSGNLPFLFLTGIFGEAILGIFSMASMLISRPIILISGSIYQVLYEKTASLVSGRKSIRPLIKNFCKKTIMIFLPCFVVLFLIARPLFIFLFGEQWAESAEYFQYLLPWMFMILLTTSIGFIPIIIKKQHKTLWLELLYLAARVFSLLIAVYMNNFKLGIVLFSAVGFLFMLGTLLWYFILINKYENALLKNQ